MADGIISFDQWAQQTAYKQRGICAICGLPPEVREQVERAWVDLGAREGAIMRYLAALGYRLESNGSIGNHFRSGRHHER